MRTLKMEVGCGEHIDCASRTASRLARTKKCGVRFNFNGISLLATPKKSPVTIGWEYEQITGKQAEQYRLSLKGQKERARNQAEVKSAQTAIDHWMLILRDVLQSGLDNTIGWLSNFLPVADRVGTTVNYPLLVGLFEGQGYKAGELTGQDKAFYEIKENLGRYIIGQVLSFWKDCGAVHPRICDFCEDYEALRMSQNQKN